MPERRVHEAGPALRRGAAALPGYRYGSASASAVPSILSLPTLEVTEEFGGLRSPLPKRPRGLTENHAQRQQNSVVWVRPSDIYHNIHYAYL